MITDDPDYKRYNFRVVHPSDKSRAEGIALGSFSQPISNISIQKTDLKEEKQEPEHDVNKEKLEKYLLGLLEKTSSGFTVVLVMYIIAFAIGIGLIITSLILAVQNDEGAKNILTVFFGTAGIVDIVLLMYRPAKEIQKSRANASKLAASVSEWFSISRGLDVTYKKLLTQGTIKENYAEIKGIVELRRDTTIKLVKAMDKYVTSEPVTENTGSSNE